MKSLRGRLLTAVLLLAAGVVFTVGAAAYTGLQSFLIAQIDEQMIGAIEPVRADLESLRQSRLPLREGSFVELRRAGSDAINRNYVFVGDRGTRPRLPIGITVGEYGKAFQTIESNDGSVDYRLLAEGAPRGEGELLIATPLDGVGEALGRLATLWLAAASIALMVLVLVGRRAVDIALRPLDDVADAAGRFATGDLTARVPRVDQHTEVGRLGGAFNSMAEEIESAFAVRVESAEKLRQFVADASHELRTPLAAIRGYAELQRKSERHDSVEIRERIEAEAARMSVLVEDLLLLARLDQHRPLERELIDLVAVTADAVESLRAISSAQSITFKAPEPVAIIGDQDRLRQLANNLLSNAHVHTPPGTRIRVEVYRNGDCAILEVADRGPGMASDRAARVFERFYRADASRARSKGGTGLGLAIVDAIAKAHGGRVNLITAPGAGASFRVELPVTTDL